MAVFDQHFLDDILDLFHGGDVVGRRGRFQQRHDLVGQAGRDGPVAAADRHRGAIDGVGDALTVEGYHRAGAFDDVRDPSHINLLEIVARRRTLVKIEDTRFLKDTGY